MIEYTIQTLHFIEMLVQHFIRARNPFFGNSNWETFSFLYLNTGFDNILYTYKIINEFVRHNKIIIAKINITILHRQIKSF